MNLNVHSRIRKTARGCEVSARTLKSVAQCHVVNTKCHQRIRSKKGLIIVSLNVNGPRTKLDELNLLLNDSDINMLALSETKVDSSINMSEIPLDIHLDIP